MKNPTVLYLPLMVTLGLLCGPVQAATWQICDLQLRVTEVVKRPYPQLEAQVMSVSPASPQVECPPVQSALSFIPETADYQSTLPRRNWPEKGQQVRIKYRYLDGICKGDGHDYPCRIKHYSVVAR